MAAGPRGQPLVSDHPAIPPGTARRLGRCVPQNGRGAEQDGLSGRLRGDRVAECPIGRPGEQKHQRGAKATGDGVVGLAVGATRSVANLGGESSTAGEPAKPRPFLLPSDGGEQDHADTEAVGQERGGFGDGRDLAPCELAPEGLLVSVIGRLDGDVSPGVVQVIQRQGIALGIQRPGIAQERQSDRAPVALVRGEGGAAVGDREVLVGIGAYIQGCPSRRRWRTLPDCRGSR